MKHFNVVAAVIFLNDKVLCMQKGKTQYDYISFKYEFPGGKIEAGESPEQALKRELEEEMNYNVTIEEKLINVEYSYPDFEISLIAFRCKVINDVFCMKEHISFKWLSSKELLQPDWCAADMPIAKYVYDSIK